MFPPRNPFSPQQRWYQPRTIHQSVSSPQNKLFLSLPRGPVSQPQTFTVHTCLPQTVFVKYQCICCPGGVPPKTSCTIHTHHSLFFFCFFLSFFVCVCCKSFSKSKMIFFSPTSMILSFFVATDNLQSAFLQREVPEALGFSMVQNGMLWLEHTPATLLWDSSTERLVGRRRFVFFLLSLFLSLF